jgi:hypothetical protein
MAGRMRDAEFDFWRQALDNLGGWKVRHIRRYGVCKGVGEFGVKSKGAG